MKKLLKPAADWGPSKPEDRELYLQSRCSKSRYPLQDVRVQPALPEQSALLIASPIVKENVVVWFHKIKIIIFVVEWGRLACELKFLPWEYVSVPAQWLSRPFVRGAASTYVDDTQWQLQLSVAKNPQHPHITRRAWTSNYNNSYSCLENCSKSASICWKIPNKFLFVFFINLDKSSSAYLDVLQIWMIMEFAKIDSVT